MKRSFRVLLASTISLLLFIPAGLAETNSEEQFTVGAPSNPSDIGIQFEDVSSLNTIPTILTAGEIPFEEFICTSITDPRCSSSHVMRFKAMMPPCSITITSDCISNFYAIRDDGTRIDGVLDDQIGNVQYGYTADRGINLPVGGVQSLWRLPGIVNTSGTNLFALSFGRSAISQKSKSTKKYSKFPFGVLNGGIFPVSIVQGQVDPKAATEDVCGLNPCIRFSDGNMRSEDGTSVDGRTCVILNGDSCAVRAGFSGNYTYGVTLKFSLPAAGWLHGRLLESKLEVTNNKRGSVLNIEGKAARVPFVGGWASKSVFGDSLKGLPSEAGKVLHATPAGEKSMQLLNAWMKALGDKAMAMPSTWMIRSLSDGEFENADKCIDQNGILSGVVTTNSTTYSAGPPTFNRKYQSLDYKLASPHFDSKGEVFHGSYVVSIRSAVARCIYGFTSAPIQARVSIVSAGGEKAVSAETVSERNGWITLSASGFTFSNPTVRIRLTQPRAKNG